MNLQRTKKPFELVTNFEPKGDQPQAIEELLKGIEEGKKWQVLLGATGTGKTFTMAQVIAKAQKPALVIVHNKTLAGQLYSEFKELFPHNRVEYFVSNFDFYQPEAYIPSSDTHIDKNAVMNEEIEMLRTSAINSLLEREDTIVVASVASIYGLTDPEEYSKLVFDIKVGDKIDRKVLANKLIEAQYKRNNLEVLPGQFRMHGDIISIMSASSDSEYIKIDTFDDEIESIDKVNLLTGEIIKSYKSYPIFPAYDHASTFERVNKACNSIMEELVERYQYFVDESKFLEAERIDLRTRQDIDSLREFGMCPGIENYSRHIDGRKPGERPFCLLDYFPEDYLVFIDESHATIPQLDQMYKGDRSRKETLVEYGFRLPSALDNRPLNREEVLSLMHTVICTSATPGPFELNETGGEIVEQIIRPTGLLDPIVEVRPITGQIDDLMYEIDERIKQNERVLICTLTVKMSEDLTKYLLDRGYKVTYLHHECKTLERTQIIYDLRKGKYDVLIGINLLREGLDIPEVSLISILDADKEGFLRSERSLIQVIGRAARNENGKVIMYADEITDSMRNAISETSRRREIQEEYNRVHNIVPHTVEKPIREPISNYNKDTFGNKKGKFSTKKSVEAQIKEMRSQMQKAAADFDFERAIELRDAIFELEAELKS